MIKTLLTLALLASALATASPAHASTTIEDEVLEVLVREASTITLIDKDSKKNLDPILQLTALIANNLTHGFKATYPATGTAVLTDVSIVCKNVTPKMIAGASSYECNVMFYSGDFPVKNGWVSTSPDTESTISITVPVQRVVYPGAKPTLKSKRLEATVAG